MLNQTKGVETQQNMQPTKVAVVSFPSETLIRETYEKMVQIAGENHQHDTFKHGQVPCEMCDLGDKVAQSNVLRDEVYVPSVEALALKDTDPLLILEIMCRLFFMIGLKCGEQMGFEAVAGAVGSNKEAA